LIGPFDPFELGFWRRLQEEKQVAMGGAKFVGKVLSATAGPSDYAQRINTLLKRHYEYGRIKMLAVARKIATPAQRQALAKGEPEATIRGGS
jgi:hypothetical protein